MLHRRLRAAGLARDRPGRFAPQPSSPRSPRHDRPRSSCAPFRSGHDPIRLDHLLRFPANVAEHIVSVELALRSTLILFRPVVSAETDADTLDLGVASFKLRHGSRFAQSCGERKMTMETRIFGRSGLRLSILGFGCGAVGGLMVRGSPADQDKAVGLALDAGVNYFDTAVQYGAGVSETNLGRILGAYRPKGIAVGTKVRVPSANTGAIAKTISESLDGSLQRLKMDHVDIFHLHNPITSSGGGETLSIAQVRSEVIPAFEALRRSGKAHFLGITAIGDTEVIDSDCRCRTHRECPGQL